MALNPRDVEGYKELVALVQNMVEVTYEEFITILQDKYRFTDLPDPEELMKRGMLAAYLNGLVDSHRALSHDNSNIYDVRLRKLFPVFYAGLQEKIELIEKEIAKKDPRRN